jgi:hypothetical protein
LRTSQHRLWNYPPEQLPQFIGHQASDNTIHIEPNASAG